VARNADAAERTLNGSVVTEPPSVTEAGKQVGEPAETSARCDVDTDTAEEEQSSAAAENDADTADEEQAGADTDSDAGGPSDKPAPHSGIPGFRLALAVELASVLALGAVAGWLGYGAYKAHQTDQLRNEFLAVGKQGALNLTTINYTQADADVQRVLDSSTGKFYDEFSKRAPSFIDVVKQVQSKTEGRITEAGVESISADSARVLVAVAVNTSNRGSADQPLRQWRMRIDVQKAGDAVNVSDVGFVP
jgi:Mce-associated membrane protein